MLGDNAFLHSKNIAMSQMTLYLNFASKLRNNSGTYDDDIFVSEGHGLKMKKFTTVVQPRYKCMPLKYSYAITP